MFTGIIIRKMYNITIWHLQLYKFGKKLNYDYYLGTIQIILLPKQVTNNYIQI